LGTDHADYTDFADYKDLADHTNQPAEISEIRSIREIRAMLLNDLSEAAFLSGATRAYGSESTRRNQRPPLRRSSLRWPHPKPIHQHRQYRAECLQPRHRVRRAPIK
jgi:hypothetical protein